MNWTKGIARFWTTIQIALIYIIAIFLVYFMFPREGKFRYEYAKNKPWMHENLVAPFDFPIFKTDQQVQREMDSLISNQLFYFLQDSLVGNSMVQAFNRDYNSIASSMGLDENITDRLSMTRQVIANVLQEVYSIGIIERHLVLEDKVPEQTRVMVLNDDLADEYPLTAFFSLRSAYEYVTKDISGSGAGSMSILNRMNLNDYLAPSILYDEAMTLKVHQAAMDEMILTQVYHQIILTHIGIAFIFIPERFYDQEIRLGNKLTPGYN